MDKQVCGTCPYFEVSETPDADSPLDYLRGLCKRNPPVYSPIGGGFFPPVTSMTGACGDHPAIFSKRYGDLAVAMGDSIATMYESIAPRLMALADPSNLPPGSPSLEPHDELTPHSEG